MNNGESGQLTQIIASVADMTDTLNKLVRAVEGEIDAGNVGLVRRVAAVEKRQDADKRDVDTQISALKIKMAGYGFLGSGAGAGFVYAIIEANRAAG